MRKFKFSLHRLKGRLVFLIITFLFSFYSQAAVIAVEPGLVDPADDGKCSLVEAINNANSDTQAFMTPGECGAGSGRDVVELAVASVYSVLVAAEPSLGNTGANGLPTITSEVEILGNRSTIERSSDSKSGEFRLIKADAGAELFLKDVSLKQGRTEYRGGAIWAENARLGLENVALEFNTAEVSGGAIFVARDSQLTIADSRISNNLVSGSTGGGGIHIAIENELIHQISNSVISGNLVNSDTGIGGGLWADSGNLDIVNSVIHWNRANNGGGIYAGRGLTLNISNSVVSRNSAVLGAGIVMPNSPSELRVTRSWITDNEASTSAGGIWSQSATLNIQDSTLSRNTAAALDPTTFVQGGGGAILHRQASSGDLTIERSTLSENFAQNEGGGVYFWAGNLIVQNSTFVANSSGAGGGVWIGRDTQSADLINNTMSGNVASSGASLLVSGATNLPSPLKNLANNLMADSPSGTECQLVFVEIETQSGNHIEDGSCGAEFSGDPGLGAFEFHDASIQTFLPTVQMVDLADAAFCPDDDQRGFGRNDDLCDIGAVELTDELLLFSPFDMPEPAPLGLFYDGFSMTGANLWQVVSGTWIRSKGTYGTESGTGGVALLPSERSNYVVEADIRDISDGGIWVRAINDGQGSLGPRGILLVTGGLGGGGEGLYWHVDEGNGLGEALELNNSLALNGASARIRVEVIAGNFKAYVNNSPTIATELDLSAEQFELFPSGVVGLYDNADSQSFDAIFVDNLPE